MHSTPHAYTQRRHWTGFCESCGLPPENTVHTYELPIELPAEDFVLTSPEIRYAKPQPPPAIDQLSLFAA